MPFPFCRRRLLAAALCLAALPFTRAEEPFSFAATPGRLPKDAVPRHYALTLRPDTRRMISDGEVTIELEVLQPTSQLVLNAISTEFSAAAVDGVAVALPATDEAGQTVTVSAGRTLAPGRHTLRLAFRSHIERTAQGLYLEKYPTAAGEKQMLGTQFESTDARRMFPCWDEPVFRATFQLTVTVPDSQVAVSNTPIESEHPVAGGGREVTFARTPPMASYLLVLCRGELEVLRGEVDGVQLGIYTTEGKRDRARYALEAAQQIVHYYNGYFGVKYPLPKLDLIAVPGGFGGAMENWGGITFNEAALLYDPATSPESTKQRVYAIIAHEVAHQWFGDLVTMAWWDNLWLNEGFASWMGTKATDHFNPDWQAWKRANAEKETAMARDALRTTHPIQQPIRNEDEANDAFDSITYLKGQGFLRMLETYLGEDVFRDGLRRYMTLHAYGSATTADLWAALEQASGKPVRALAANWTEQPGFPVVTVTPRAVDGRVQVDLRQEHFTLNDPAPAKLGWKIPVVLAPAGDPGHAQTVLLEGAQDTVLLPVPAGTPILANVGGTGFFRTAYSTENAKALSQRFHLLSETDRVGLLADTGALVDAGRASPETYLELAGRLDREDASLALWQQAVRDLESLDNLERDQPGRAAFRAWYRGRLREPFTRLGWEARPGEPETDALLRALVIGRLGYLGDPAVVNEARARFTRFQQDPASLPADLRDPVFLIVGRHATPAEWDALHALARAARTMEDQRRYFHALTFAEDPALARQALELTLTDEPPILLAARMVAGVSGNGDQPALAWSFAREHSAQLIAKITAFERNTYFPLVAAPFTDAARADELEEFVARVLPPEARAETARMAERIRFQAALKASLLPAVDAWIARHR